MLEPVGYADRWPEFAVCIDGIEQTRQTLALPKTLDFSLDLQEGKHTIAVRLLNKNDQDTQVNEGKITADMALIVRAVGIETYFLEDFLHRAMYHPLGREPLSSNYLGWNGDWVLSFDTPIFTWLHQTQHLGWIYGKNV